MENNLRKEKCLFLDGCGAPSGKWVKGHSGRTHMVNLCHSTIFYGLEVQLLANKDIKTLE